MHRYLLFSIVLLAVATVVLSLAALFYYEEITPPYAITMSKGPHIPLYVPLTIYGTLFAIPGTLLLWWYRTKITSIKEMI